MTTRNARKRTPAAPPNRFRIIAGSFRGRRFEFPDAAGVRPSPDRVRETVFNWLAPTIDGARCLDLFAGSGALGLEALSRGAAWVDFVDRDRQLLAAIEDHLKVLGCRNAAAIFDDATHFLQSGGGRYDIVFLDPPFDRDLLPDLCRLLASGDRLNPGAKIYLERHAKREAELPDGWSMWRDATAGQVRFGVVVVASGSPP